ncbi:MAG: vitamin B12 dependent methionine synthase [Eggerthellaceae bacterium]|nr:vitamin B12 dependent methionine synthase [Eggerthellaceae bacterium]
MTGASADLAAVGFGPCALDCSVDVPRALRYLGHRRQELPDHLEERVRSIARRCEETARPRGIARIFPLARPEGEDALLLEGPQLRLPGEAIARFLDGCTHAVLLAVTLGMENERALRQAQALSAVDGLLMDGCSSSLAESAANAASALLEPQARAVGFEPTKRFSPGYGDLPLSVQPALLQALDAEKLLGIHTAPSFLMTPMKSITAIVGLKPSCAEEGR